MNVVTRRVPILLPASVLSAMCCECLLDKLDKKVLHEARDEIVIEVVNPRDRIPSRLYFYSSEQGRYKTRYFTELQYYLPLEAGDFKCEQCGEEINFTNRTPLKACSRGHVLCLACAPHFIENAMEKANKAGRQSIKCPGDFCDEYTQALDMEQIMQATQFNGEALVHVLYETHDSLLTHYNAYLNLLRSGGIQDPTHPEFQTHS